jgi:TonB family protein
MSARFVRSALSATAVLCAALACSGTPPPAYDTPPILANRDEITAAMSAIGAGLEARVVLQLRVDEQGYVRDVDVSRSSGNEQLDDAATWIAEQMRFRPAQHGGTAVPALVEIPVTFDVVKNVVHAPRLRNARQVEAIIARDYPDLRGTARLRLQIGTQGWVMVVEDRSPSDREVLPAAHQILEDRIKFWPAFREGRQVTGWVNLTIEFAGELSRVYLDSEQA